MDECDHKESRITRF